MNVEELQRKLIAAARANPPSDRVPFAFEKRIMARIADKPRLDEWALWSRALWRAAAPCFGIMVLLSAWSFFVPATPPPTNDLSQDFENTLVAAVAQDQPADSGW